jgi:predicted phage baseplate assembly protein
MNKPCGCCAGIEVVTPQELINRPGLSALAYRVGTHTTFLESMLARLSSASPIVEGGAQPAGTSDGTLGGDGGQGSESVNADDGSEGGHENGAAYGGRHDGESAPEASPEATPATAKPARPVSPLSGLQTRQPDDPSVALLDAWATVADVLTFYQERIANEGYLRTAVERRSVVELARLLGYRPRPGVASSVHLAFTLQSGFDVTIPAGTAALTTPGPGELPQTFETSEPSDARAQWNELLPRRTQPQRITELNASEIGVIYFDGVGTKLKPNDRLLLVFGDEQGKQFMRAVEAVDEDQQNKRTRVTLQIGQFSAAQFAIEVQKILREQIKNCPKLDDVQAVKDLKAALQKSNPLSALSAALKGATDEITRQVDAAQASFKDLTTIHGVATSLATKLAGVLGQPHAVLATNVESVLDAFSAQETHAANVEAALGGFDFKPNAVLAPQVAALLAADAVLVAEAKETADFKVLARAITNQQADWQPAVTGLQNAVKKALTDAGTSIAKAVVLNAPGDADLINQLNAIKTKFDGVANKPAGDQTAQLEQAATELKSAKAKNSELKTALGEIQSSLTVGVAAVKQSLQEASDSSQSHPELQPQLSPETQAALTSVRVSLQTLKGKLLVSPLSEQREAMIETTDLIDEAAATAGLPLLVKQRFDELTRALERAPGDVVKGSLVDALDSVTIPSLTNAKAKAHATTVKNLVQPVRAAAGSLDAIARAGAARNNLNDEAEAIQADLDDAQSGQDCFRKAVEVLVLEQTRFTAHFKQQFATLHLRFSRSIPDTPNRQIALDAIAQLQKALEDPKVVTLSDLVKGVGDALKEIDKARDLVPSPDAPLRGWFGDLSRALHLLMDALTISQAKPPVIVEGRDAFAQLQDIAKSLLLPTLPGTPTTPDLKTVFSFGSDAVARSLLVLKPGLGDQLLQGWGNIKVDLPVVEVYAFRVRASLFGFNAPRARATDVTNLSPAGSGQRFVVREDGDPDFDENPEQVDLDASYDQVLPSSWVVVQRPAAEPLFARAGQTNPGIGLAKYAMTGKTTEVLLTSPPEPHQPVSWFERGKATDFNMVRGTIVWAQAEQLTLAEEPITDPVGRAAQQQEANPAGQQGQEKEAKSILLDGYFDGLKAGRFVAITGERTKESVGVDGLRGTELARIAAVEQNLDTTLPGDTLHTKLLLTVNLRHQYKRETVKINANVAHATHGETRKEVLGSGDGGQSFQTFKLSKTPLTYLSKPTPSGAESTLAVRVNDLLWHEADNLAGLGPNDRKYTVNIEDDGATLVVFGDGVHGGRLPTGTENVRSVYRSGIGKPGNVVPTKIGVLPSPPLGVTAVNNPSPATGGADPETRDQTRRNAPVAVLALDRLVSVRDYADFARTYAGIAKANANSAAGVVTVTVAGIDDIPIDPSSDLFGNLFASLEEFGDPHQAVKLQVRKLNVLVLQMGVVVHPDYDFNVVKDKIRAALLDRFGFDQQELGEPIILSQLISVGQQIAGVEFVDVELFGAIPEIEDPDPNKIIEAIDRLKAPKDFEEFVATAPHEITYFSPALPETIVLKQTMTEGNQ